MPDNDVLLTLVSELEGFKLSSGNGTSAEGVKNHNRMMMLSARFALYFFPASKTRIEFLISFVEEKYQMDQKFDRPNRHC